MVKLSELRTAGEVHEQDKLDLDYRREYERTRLERRCHQGNPVPSQAPLSTARISNSESSRVRLSFATGWTTNGNARPHDWESACLHIRTWTV